MEVGKQYQNKITSTVFTVEFIFSNGDAAVTWEHMTGEFRSGQIDKKYFHIYKEVPKKIKVKTIWYIYTPNNETKRSRVHSTSYEALILEIKQDSNYKILKEEEVEVEL